MIRIAIMCVAIFFSLAFCAPSSQGKYTNKYDSLDIDQILHNERLFLSYVNCLLNDEGCTPDATELKEVLPEALKGECTKCSDVQKDKAEKVFVYVYNKKREVFDKLAHKFDPKGEHRQHYRKFAEERGIKF